MAKKEAKTLDELFHDTLKDIYFAEKKILATLPKMEKAAQAPDLKQAFSKHRTETEGHVDRLEKVLEFAHGALRQSSNVGEICLKWRPIRHNEDAVIPLFLSFLYLQDFQNTDRLTAQHEPRIGRRLVDDEDVDRIAVIRLCRRNEPPIIGIRQTGKQGLGQCENVEFGVKLKLGVASPRRLNDSVNVRRVCPSGQLRVIDHHGLDVSDARTVPRG